MLNFGDDFSFEANIFFIFRRLTISFFAVGRKIKLMGDDLGVESLKSRMNKAFR